MVTVAHRRALIIQFSGDYRESFQRLSSGGPETYYAQKHSVEETARLGDEVAAIGMLCIHTPEAYDELLANGVRAAGLGPADSGDWERSAVEFIERFQATHLIFSTPLPGLMRAALARGVQVLPLFADTFQAPQRGNPVLRWLRKRRFQLFKRRLGAVLTDPGIRWVCNHNVNACRQLAGLGVAAFRIVPWDWPAIISPAEHQPKELNPDPASQRNIVFVGALIEEKGALDAVRAVARLKQAGMSLRLRVVGAGNVSPLREAAQGADVEFLGQLPHQEVIRIVRDSDLALAPSWHSYSEGLPMTIYEALATRTPVICSDHPAFVGRLGQGVVMVPQQRPDMLAAAIRHVLSDAQLYRSLSEATAIGWERIRCEAGYHEVIRHWLRDTPADDAWLAAHSLSSGRYDATQQPSVRFGEVGSAASSTARPN